MKGAVTDAGDGQMAEAGTADGLHVVATAEEVVPPGRLAVLGARVGCTEGQLYTMVIATVSAVSLLLFGGVPLGTPPHASATAGRVSSAAPGFVAPPPSPSAPATLAPLRALPTAELPSPALPPEIAQPSPNGSVSTPPTTVGPTGPFRVPTPGAPAAVAVGADDVYVGTDNTGAAPSRLFTFPLSAGSTHSLVITGQSPSHTGGLSAAVLWGDRVLTTDRSRAALLEIDPRSGTQHVLVKIPDLPPCLVGVTGTCQPGAQDSPPSLEGLAVRDGYAFIADAGQGTIWRYGLDSHQLMAWFASSDFAAGGGPAGLAVDGAGQLFFTVDTSANPSAFLKPALYKLPIGSDGTAGTAVLMTTFASGSSPGPVAAGRSGLVYVGLRGTGAVMVVSPAGNFRSLATPGTTIGAPTGLCLVEGVLYVVDQGRPAAATSGRALAVRVNDGPYR